MTRMLQVVTKYGMSEQKTLIGVISLILFLKGFHVFLMPQVWGHALTAYWTETMALDEKFVTVC